MKAAEKELQLFHTTVKPYQDAQKLVRDERVSRTIYPEIEKMYDARAPNWSKWNKKRRRKRR